MSQTRADGKSSELIRNPDGSIYHLSLHPGELAPLLILVGDPGRVEIIARLFDKVTVERSHREFVTRTGTFNGLPVSVISTGISTDNVDIVMNEVDALFNVDLATGEPLTSFTRLTFVRLGTSGSIQPDIEVDSIISTAYAVGLDGLDNHYIYSPSEDESALESLISENNPGTYNPALYATTADELLLDTFDEFAMRGITLTCPGFYGPQGRELRIKSRTRPFIDNLRRQQFKGLRFTNIEMESSGIYLLASLMGHSATSLNVVLANRYRGTFTSDSVAAVRNLINRAMDALHNTRYDPGVH